MRAFQKWVMIIWPAALMTAFAFVACPWAVSPVFSPIGLGRYDTTALIKHAFPIRLVQPDWIADQSNLYFAWSISEARARFFLIVACWVGACATIVYIRVKGATRAET